MNPIDKLIETYQEEAIEIREHLHKYPELSGQEFKTTKFIEEKLKSYNITICDFSLNTGVIGYIKGKCNSPLIAVRADIDALPIMEQSGESFSSLVPNISHCCGHDIHISTSLLAAKILNELKNELYGSVLFIFQPSEETMLGAKTIIKSGVFKQYQPNFIIAAHTWPFLEAGKIGLLKKEFMSSSHNFKIQVLGKGGHGAHPENCIDPILIATNIVNFLQTIISRMISPLDSAVLTIGQIYGGSAPNIIPDEIILEGTLRTVKNETYLFMKEKIESISINIAKSMNGDAKFEFFEGCPPVENNTEIVEQFEISSKKILGKDNIIYLSEPSMGSEDFAFYLQKFPGMMFRLGTSNNHDNSKIGLHNSKIIFDNKSIITGGAIIANFIYDMLQKNTSYKI